MARLLGVEAFSATLSGAKLIAGDQVLIVRDAGEARRGGLKPLALEPGQTGVWDGRFEITAGPAPLTVRVLSGRAKALPKDQQARLRSLDAAARPALPILDLGDGRLTCPILAEPAPARVRPLIAARLRAACGVILKEPAT